GGVGVDAGGDRPAAGQAHADLHQARPEARRDGPRVGPDPGRGPVLSGRRERSEPPEPLGAETVDAHTHLDACGCETAEDVVAAMDRAAAVGVTRAVTVADDLPSARWVVRAAHWDARVTAAVALHPTRTADVSEDDFAEIERLAADPRVVAVGETGLDYYWDYSP